MWRYLHAGPLRIAFAEGDLRRISLGEREILRRVYVAVRDRNWGTIAGRIENLAVVERGRHFTITYDSIHQQGEIDFRWHATITGSESGKVSFAMDGKAHSTFLRSRIGFCVHHPLKFCAGKPCVVQKTDGRRETGVFPEFVSPHQPFLDIFSITHEAAPGVEAEVRFHGDSFEMEDHRNWTDAGYKTYSTPLSQPFPVEVKAGAGIHQMVELVLHGTVKPAPPSRPGPVTIRVAAKPVANLPRLGLCVAGGAGPLSPADAEALNRLGLKHLRVDAVLESDFRRALERGAAKARALGVKLEIAVTMPGPVEELRKWSSLADRWLVFHRNEKVASAQTVAEVRRALGPEAFLVAGTDAYFAELNRNRPSGDGWNASSFSLNPQVHAFDDASMMENVAAQSDAVRSAQRFLGGRPVFVSPVTLRPRFNPDATSTTTNFPPDPRQKLQFCAAWTVGSLKHLAEAGAAGVTYFETHGPGGLVDGGNGFPVMRVFEWAGEFAGGDVFPCESSDDLRVAALVLASGARRRMLVANLTDQPETARVGFSRTPVKLAPYGVEKFDWQAK